MNIKPIFGFRSEIIRIMYWWCIFHKMVEVMGIEPMSQHYVPSRLLFIVWFDTKCRENQTKITMVDRRSTERIVPIEQQSPREELVQHGGLLCLHEVVTGKMPCHPGGKWLLVRTRQQEREKNKCAFYSNKCILSHSVKLVSTLSWVCLVLTGDTDIYRKQRWFHRRR